MRGHMSVSQKEIINGFYMSFQVSKTDSNEEILKKDINI